ncbi:SDR family oxidoreductase [Massilia sp. Dwa41.01b]|uniref:SDR family NAD(P)-dependent oxidoreductase n=1 Tax=Massilia sp. Dwa41.01b TaxID=2709302 RepID=UPI001E4A25D6|nr:SDR family oxidoreductase [Massilia sp. Dwa41.01b]
MNLTNRVALVTGAGSGIGRATAVALARRGCHLALCDIDAAGLEESAWMLGTRGVRVTTHVLDVADREAVRALPPAIHAAHKRLDVLVNNAGVATGGSFEQVSEADFDWLMEINFGGVVRMTRAFLPLLRASDEARIVNVSSIYGIVSPPGQVAYSSSKFAVRGFSNALRHELEGSTVGVSVVHPGGVTTAIARSARCPLAPRLKMSNADAAWPSDCCGCHPRPPEKSSPAASRRAPRASSSAPTPKSSPSSKRLAPVHYWRLLKKAASR